MDARHVRRVENVMFSLRRRLSLGERELVSVRFSFAAERKVDPKHKIQFKRSDGATAVEFTDNT